MLLSNHVDKIAARSTTAISIKSKVVCRRYFNGALRQIPMSVVIMIMLIIGLTRKAIPQLIDGYELGTMYTTGNRVKDSPPA